MYRINVIPLNVPNLKERAEDITVIAEYILGNLRKQMNIPALTLCEAAKTALVEYSFPGNVRELENILERAATLCEADTIDINDLALPKVTPRVDADMAAELDDYLDNVERAAIMKALEKNRWNKTKTAKELGMTLRALRYRLGKLGID